MAWGEVELMPWVYSKRLNKRIWRDYNCRPSYSARDRYNLKHLRDINASVSIHGGAVPPLPHDNNNKKVTI